MKKHILFAGLLAILVPGINPGTARAQDSIKVSDEKLILKAAENSLASFQELLNNLCNPENTEDDKMQVVKNAFGKENPQFKFFLNEHVQIDDDQDPAGSKGETDADLYLNQFSHSLTGSDGAVQFKITSKSLIKTQNKSLYLNVYYTETFNGKCMLPGKQDQVYPERVRVAQMQVRPDVITTWKCLISNVKDYDKEHDPITSAPNVKIYNAESSKDLAVKLQPEAYYASKYALGNARFGDGDYMGAYIAYRDCAPSPVYGPLSEQKIGNDLKNKFTPYSPDSFYQKGLTERVEGFKSKKNFAAAKKCYQYLYEITPTDKFLPGAIEEMTNLLDEQKQIAELYYKHLYKDAIARYTLAISRNGDVPDLYIGRAKCYAAEGRFQEAENDFNKAISTDRSNVNAYVEQASYFINAAKQSAQV